MHNSPDGSGANRAQTVEQTADEVLRRLDESRVA
jgi:hypothetical protein